ncbi:Polar organelle development protein [Moraxella lacunata]|uniref:Polar organelle development protein n=1 Tax=Moraxella lacunata TaxID=477 RepID=A0A1V4GLL2_MORLA|nr:DUF3761 domain-containing protein [Moraxella lacunata]OPH33514.1 hypothetical protein B5J94_12965 [Moraxella lacunata]STZ01122.1 Polar organelle development protein [Moraxella lacunata]
MKDNSFANLIVACIYAPFIIGFLYLVIGVPLNDKNNFDKKVQQYENMAKSGDVLAQSDLAKLYKNGNGILFDIDYGVDLQKSAYWYEQLALQGNAEAQYKIAEIYQNGIGIPVNLQNASYWYEQSALQNNSYAQFQLAENWKNGAGVPKNNNNAIYWYTKSAENNNTQAMEKIGIIYHDGLLGVAKNKELALSWFQKLRDMPNYIINSDINARLYFLENPIEIAKPQQPELQIPQQQYTNTNKYYPSEHYGYSKEPTAQCWDGTYSYSLGRRGVCSGHGGVKYWF